MKRRTIGGDIVQRLKELNKTIADGKSVTERFTCSRVILNLDPQDYDPAMVKRTRKLLRVSQSLFAQFLGFSASAVRAWEQGINPVPLPACRFMDEIQRNPPYWKQRLQESVVEKQCEPST